MSTTSKRYVWMMIASFHLTRTLAAQSFDPTTITELKPEVQQTGYSRINGIAMPLHIFQNKKSAHNIALNIKKKFGETFAVFAQHSFNQDIIMIAPKLRTDEVKPDPDTLISQIYTISTITLGDQSLTVGSQTGLLYAAKPIQLKLNHPALAVLDGIAEVKGSAEYKFANTYAQQEEIFSREPLGMLMERVRTACLKLGYTTPDGKDGQASKEQLVFNKGKSVIYLDGRRLDDGMSKLSFQEIIANGVQ